MTSPGQGDTGEPLLVRRYLHSPVRGGAATRTDVRWPASVDQPTVVSAHELPLDLPPAEPTVYGTPVGAPRRRRAVVLAAAGAVAAAGLATAGYVVFAPGDPGEKPQLIAGAPPRALPSPSEGAVAGPDRSGEDGAATPGPTVTTTGNGTGGGPATTEDATEPEAAPQGEAVQQKPADAPAGTPSSPATSAPVTSAPATQGTRNPLLLAPPPAAPGQAAARTGRITADDGRCLDLFANNPADGNRIQVFTCNGTSAQNFTIGTDGTLRVRDKCTDVSRFATVRITGCGDRDVTRWRIGSNGTLTSASSGRCLTRPPTGRESVSVSRCSGGATQRWTLPS